MPESLAKKYKPLLEAVSFAARAHQGQLRKDKETPYVSHVFRACLVVRHVFGIDDPMVLTTAALHDTVEDTTTDYDDLEEQFGEEVAKWVWLLSKDKRKPEENREDEYGRQLAGAPWQVKVCKLADIFDNLLDASPQQRQKTVKNAHRYLTALKQDLPNEAKKPWEVVSRLLAEVEGQGGGGA
jgi:guanosine-3',5'-bis(diphosphate) 3'-pyrophosphohydrolase